MPHFQYSVSLSKLVLLFQLFLAEPEQSRNIHCSSLPNNCLIHSAIVMGDQISHSLHWSPLNSVSCGLPILGKQAPAQFPNLEDGETDRTLIIGVRFIYRKGIAIALYGFGNCNTVIRNILNSLQIRRHHLDSPFPS